MKPTRFTILLAVIVLLAALYRLYQLDLYPQHFDHDESVLAYDGWSIWTTGADHHGAVMPDHFRAFNEYLPGLAQYIEAPFVGLLGLNEWNARLPFALMGIATVLITALIGRRWFNETAGLLAALLLATEPWHITFSRLALTNSAVPFFTVLALYSFTHAADRLSSTTLSQRSKVIGIALSALLFALLSRTYQPLKIEGPLLFAGCLVALSMVQRGSWKLILLWLGFYLLFISPQWIDQFIHWDVYQVQFNHNNILRYPEWPLLFLRNYLSQYSLTDLFIDGFGGRQSSHPPGIGQLFWLEIFLWLVGIVGLFKKRLLRESEFRLTFLLVWWFLIWPIAAALTITDVPTETRTINFLPLPELLAGYGAALVFYELRNLNRRTQRILIYAVVVPVIGIYVTYNIYFIASISMSVKTADISPESVELLPYNVGLEPVLQAVVSQSTDCDPIWVDERGTSQAYIYYLFYTKFPPKKFQEAARYEIAVPPDDFNHVSWFANVRFADIHTLLDPSSFKLTLPPLCSGSHQTFIVAHQALDKPDLHEIASSKSQSGITIWAAYRKET